MRSVYWDNRQVKDFIDTVQPKTGTPAGCRGVLTPIHFASHSGAITGSRWHPKRLAQPCTRVKPEASCRSFFSFFGEGVVC